jgi:transcriptional regulator with XRE-family HTH domain
MSDVMDMSLNNSPRSPAGLGPKIAKLVEERGWNQEEFARLAGLNRQTVHQILQADDRRLRNATTGACAKALGLSVSDLLNLPLDRLLPRMNGATLDLNSKARLYDLATQPELIGWLESNPDRAAQLDAGEVDELLSLQGTGGPLTAFGVEHFVELIERKRRLRQKVDAVAGTEFLDLLEQMVNLMYEKVRPYADRS